MGRVKAHYHCNHTSIGRTTHRAGTGGAHAKYVLRQQAAREVIGEHMPLGRSAASAWIDRQEQAERKNGRVLDRINIGLPVELTQAERTAVVREFAHAMTDGGRTAWLAVIHDKGDDAANPHAHVIIRDKDLETGARVFGMSKKGSTERVRELWETIGNKHLEMAERAHGVEIGSYGRLDRRTLEAQGIERQPQIHIGPQAQAIAEKGLRPESRERQQVQPCRQGVAQDDNRRTVPYPQIDQGKTRQEHNAGLVELARGREQRQQGQPVPDAEQAKREARDKEARDLALYRQSLEQAAERKRQEMERRHVQEVKSHQAAPRQAPSQAQPSGFLSRMADKLNPARVREREAEEARKRQQVADQRRRELEAMLKRQEQERAALAKQQAETQRERVREFQAQQAKIREQRAKNPKGMEPRGISQERGEGFGRERGRDPRRFKPSP